MLEEALEIFDACWRLIRTCRPTLAWWALENPVGRLKRLRPELGEPTLIFNPFDYGDAYSKKTLVWGQFNIPPRTPVKPEGSRPGQPNAWYSRVGGKSEATKRHRSATPPGFARAFYEVNK